MTGQELKKWLDASGRSRKWLAAQLGVSLRTVEGWCGNGYNERPIRSARAAQIEALLSAPHPGAEVGTIELTLKLSSAEWEKIAAQFANEGEARENVTQQMIAILRALHLPEKKP